MTDAYVNAVSTIPTLDRVPARWRHITMTGVGHVQAIPDELRESIVSRVQERLADASPRHATLRATSVFREAVALRRDYPTPFTHVQQTLQRATAELTPCADPPNPNLRAHVTVAYGNGPQDATTVRKALNNVQPGRATAQCSGVDLIRMNRDHRMYVWDAVARIPLGTQRTTTQ